MEVEVTLTVEDLIARDEHVLERQLSRRAWLSGSTLIIFAIVAAITVALYATGRLDSSITIIIGVVAGMGCFSSISVLGQYLFAGDYVRRHYKTFAKCTENAWLFQAHRLKIAPDGISISFENYRLNHTWDIVNKVEMVGSRCFLFFTTAEAHIVPQCAFPDEENFLRFIVLARQYKSGERAADIASAPLWKVPQRPADLFDPNSSY